MASKIEHIKAEPRERVGTRAARKLRADGQVVGTLGGDPRFPHVDLSFDEHSFLATRRRHAHLYEITVGSEKTLAVVRELHWDTFGEQIQHVEFKRVQRDVKTESEVELEFRGHPKGGILNHLRTHVTVRCLPLDIPDEIEVLVASLDEGDSVFARDLKAPAGVEILLPPDARIAVVVAAKVEVAPAAAPADAAAAATPATPAT